MSWNKCESEDESSHAALGSRPWVAYWQVWVITGDADAIHALLSEATGCSWHWYSWDLTLTIDPSHTLERVTPSYRVLFSFLPEPIFTVLWSVFTTPVTVPHSCHTVQAYSHHPLLTADLCRKGIGESVLWKTWFCQASCLNKQTVCLFFVLSWIVSYV